MASGEYAAMKLGDEAAFFASAATLVRRYFELEDPTTIRPIGLELLLTAPLGEHTKVRLRGIIDRLELDDDGGLVVTDYKTGKVPGERQEQGRLTGVHFYSYLCESLFGRRPSRIQLLYLGEPVAIVTTPSEQSTRGLEKKVGDLVGDRAGVRARRLPAQAQRAVQLVLVQGPLPGVRRDGAGLVASRRGRHRDRGARRRAQGRGPAGREPGRDGPPRLVRVRVKAFDDGVDRAFDAIRGNPIADRIMYGASALGDFSLLWHLAGVSRALLGDEKAGREAVRLAGSLLVETALINAGVKSLFRRSRPDWEQPRPHSLRKPRSSSFPSGHATSASWPPRCWRPAAHAAGRCGSRWRRSWRRAGCTSASTTAPTWPPAR